MKLTQVVVVIFLILVGASSPVFSAEEWPVVIEIVNSQSRPVYLQKGTSRKTVRLIPAFERTQFVFSGQSYDLKFASGLYGIFYWNFSVSLDRVAEQCKSENPNWAVGPLYLCKVVLEPDEMENGFLGSGYRLRVREVKPLWSRRGDLEGFFDQYRLWSGKTVDWSQGELETTRERLLKDLVEAPALRPWLENLQIALSQRAKRDQKDSFNFLIFGDQGKTETAKIVARSMHKVCGVLGCTTGISSGDSIYPMTPVVSDPLRDDLFVAHFVEVFSALWKDFTLPFYVALGNHDIGYTGVLGADGVDEKGPRLKDAFFESERRSRVLASVEFARSRRNPTNGPFRMWNFEGEFHALYGEQNGVSTFLIILDTNYFPGALGENPYNRKQEQWLRAILKTDQARKADWRIVVGHHFLYSVGRYGADFLQTRSEPKRISWFTRRDLLKQILCENEVDFYIAGHDHHLQVDQIECSERKSLIQILSGAASSVRNIKQDEGAEFSSSVVEANPTLVWANQKTADELKSGAEVVSSTGFSHLTLKKNNAHLEMIRGGPFSTGCWDLAKDGRGHLVACPEQPTWDVLFRKSRSISKLWD